MDKITKEIFIDNYIKSNGQITDKFSMWAAVLFFLYKLKVIRFTPFLILYFCSIFFVLLIHLFKINNIFTYIVAVFHIIPIFFCDIDLSFTNIIMSLGIFLSYVFFMHLKKVSIYNVYFSEVPTILRKGSLKDYVNLIIKF